MLLEVMLLEVMLLEATLLQVALLKAALLEAAEEIVDPLHRVGNRLASQSATTMRPTSASTALRCSDVASRPS